MREMGVLVSSSPETIRWLYIVKSNIKKKIPSLEYHESKYWASFKRPNTRNIAYLDPSKSRIRLFTRLPLSFGHGLEPSPASMEWKRMYPTVFKMASENAIEEATFLIIESYHFDLGQEPSNRGN